MRDKGIRAAISAVLIAAAVSIPSAGLCARANSPGCEAVFSVICEEGYEKDVEFLLTDEETGETVTASVGAADGYRKNVTIPPGTYTASAFVQDPDKDYEVFVDDRPKEAAGGGICCFSAVAGSWLYTVENAGLAGITDESGGPAYYGVVKSEDAESYLIASDDAQQDPKEEEGGPEEIIEKQQGTDVPGAADGPAESEDVMPVEEPPAGQEETPAYAPAGKKFMVILCLSAVVIGGAAFIRRQIR